MNEVISATKVNNRFVKFWKFFIVWINTTVWWLRLKSLELESLGSYLRSATYYLWATRQLCFMFFICEMGITRKILVRLSLAYKCILNAGAIFVSNSVSLREKRVRITSCGSLLQAVCSYELGCKRGKQSYPTTNFFKPNGEIIDTHCGISEVNVIAPLNI